jgi:hypothetical protein
MPYTKWHYKYIINLDKKNDKNIVKDDKIKWFNLKYMIEYKKIKI